MPVAEEVKICPVSMSLLAGIKIWMERDGGGLRLGGSRRGMRGV
jgi:hypothetical protein